MASTVTIPETRISALRDLVDRGLYLQAFRLTTGLGPLRAWSGADSLVLAGRLATALGAPRLARWLQLRAYRTQRSNLSAVYYCATGMLNRQGPVVTWRFLRRTAQPSSGACGPRADLLALRGRVAAAFRDF